MNDGNVRKWCRLFNEERTNVLDGEQSGRPTDMNEDDTNNKLMRKFTKTVASLLNSFMRNFRVSRSVVYQIVIDNLHYKKVCARWVPKILTEEHKTKRLAHSLSFFERYNKEGEEFLSHIVIVREAWVAYYTLETKRHSSERHHSNSPTNPKIQARNFNEEHHGYSLMGQERHSSDRHFAQRYSNKC